MTQTTLALPAIEGPRKIGCYEVHSIETGSFALDGGAMFGIIPKPIWEKTNPADELNRIEMRLRTLLLIERKADGKRGRVVLIDNGIGEKWSEKHAKMYKIDHQRWSVERELLARGVTLDDVTDVVATHLHFDHMGGTTRREGGEIVPNFPNAQIWVQDQNWDLAYHPNEKDRASYLSENFDFYNGSSKLTRLSTTYGAREEILPGIHVRVSNGHTPGMQIVEVSDSQHALIYCADGIPTASHVRVPYIMGYDCFPLTMIEEKKKLLREATDRGMMLFFEHCPRAEAVSVSHDGKDFCIKQAYRFS